MSHDDLFLITIMFGVFGMGLFFGFVIALKCLEADLRLREVTHDKED